MSAQPARRVDAGRRDRAVGARTHPASTARAAAAGAERRRRERHLRRRRRDPLEDVALGLLLTIIALILTAGLGVIALIEIPVAGAVIGSFVLERRARKRRQPDRPRPPARRS
jgi:hypothetical protein